jgi:hypothetical protein
MRTRSPAICAGAVPSVRRREPMSEADVRVPCSRDAS